MSKIDPNISKEDIVTTIYNIIYEQDTNNKISCLNLAEEISLYIEEIIKYEQNRSKQITYQ